MADVEIEKQRQAAQRSNLNQKTPLQTGGSVTIPVTEKKDDSRTARQVGRPVTIPDTQKSSGGEGTSGSSLGTSSGQQEQNWSSQLAQDRVRQLKQTRQFGPSVKRITDRLDPETFDLTEDNENIENLKKLRQAVTGANKLRAIKIGAEIGLSLRAQIADGNFQGFIFALSLAIIKDLWDFATEFFDAGLSGALFNIAITTALLFIVMFQGIWFKRWLIKRFWKRYLAVAIAEFIPIVNFFPWWSISVYLVKRQADKRLAEQQEVLQAHMKDMEYVRQAEIEEGSGE